MLALLRMVRVAERVPSALGVKVQFRVVVIPDAMLAGNEPQEKSLALAPDKAKGEKVIVAGPLLVSETVCVELPSRDVAGNVTGGADNVELG